MELFWIVPVSALCAFLFAWIFYRGMKVEEEGTDKMKEIAEFVREGAMAYLKSQYTVVTKIFLILVVFSGVLSIVYAIIYQVVGPPRYGPLDEPAPKKRAKRYTR